MKKKEEINQLDKLWKNMKKPLKAFLASGNQEDLHQFRVNVKKLKALLTLYAFAPDSKDLLTHFKPVKKIFRKAGDIRSAYINLKLAKEHQLNNQEFNDHQQQILDKGTGEFKKKGSKYLKQLKKAHIALQNNIQPLQNRTIRHFYKDKITQIESFFANPAFNDELHNARKNIKLLTYNQKVAAKALKNKVAVKQSYLDQLQEIIGNWHDHNVAIEVLDGTGKAGDNAINNIKASNAGLEKTITEQGNNFREKVSAGKEIPVKNQPQ
ncbi:CHAD domain-containing protein [Mucilaginibacter arboris]|uniref:CHAD domain-containing protein n=1 Tax=Mucilaginibacter arboris TaxID=2682090 RepID=A0A7K1SWS6_9SPHI|nr:CHAD domain-containing protein [Mucilaginibacter arboris]MVN21743.1 CHAD domain-containing protein [Mucilaginibacter arboris]